MYQLISKDGETIGIKTTDGEFVKIIPLNPANTDYQAYLKWLEEGNVPEPADEAQ